jgi:kynureninase
LQSEAKNPITAWFGHARPFDFELAFEPAEGIQRFQVGTPHVLSLVALDAALDCFDGVSMEDVRAKSVALTELFVALVDARLGDAFEVVSPRDPEVRGSQIGLRHDHAHAIVAALIDRGVIGDFRSPDIARFGFAPLYLRFVDVWDAVDLMVDVVESETWKLDEYSIRKAVT